MINWSGKLKYNEICNIKFTTWVTKKFNNNFVFPEKLDSEKHV
jgi:hypothetical protein